MAEEQQAVGRRDIPAGARQGPGNAVTLAKRGASLSTPGWGCPLATAWMGNPSRRAHSIACAKEPACGASGSSNGMRQRIMIPVPWQTVRQWGCLAQLITRQWMAMR